jgi:hypothetical protein
MSAFHERVSQMSNEELLRETLDLAGGDDYDGCFTDKGRRQYEILEAELHSRLLKYGFLGEDK